MTFVASICIIKIWDQVITDMLVCRVLKPIAAMKRLYGDELEVENDNEDSSAQPQPSASTLVADAALHSPSASHSPVHSAPARQASSSQDTAEPLVAFRPTASRKVSVVAALNVVATIAGVGCKQFSQPLLLADEHCALCRILRSSILRWTALYPLLHGGCHR